MIAGERNESVAAVLNAVALKCADAAALADAQASQIANAKTLAQEFAAHVEGLGIADQGAAVADAQVQ